MYNKIIYRIKKYQREKKTQGWSVCSAYYAHVQNDDGHKGKTSLSTKIIKKNMYKRTNHKTISQKEKERITILEISWTAIKGTPQQKTYI